MWRHGFPASPQWEEELELDFARDCDNEYEEDDRLVARDLAAENGSRDNISVVRESYLDPGLPQPARCTGLAHGWVTMEQRDIVRRIRSLVVLSRQKMVVKKGILSLFQNGPAYASTVVKTSKHDRVGLAAGHDRLQLHGKGDGGVQTKHPQTYN